MDISEPLKEPDKQESVLHPGDKKRKKKKKNKAQAVAVEGFTVLGDKTGGGQAGRKPGGRVLPYWLSHPDIVEVDLGSEQLPVASMPRLHPLLVQQLVKEGVTHFFPVQRQLLPHLLSVGGPCPAFPPSDLCCSAPTGSGKTLAFVLPVVSSLAGRLEPCVRALAVLPTQDLASQVHKVFTTYAQPLGLAVRLVTGGEAAQEPLSKRGVGGRVHQLADILVATPGRLVHTLRDQPDLSLAKLRYLVIDEADRLVGESLASAWLSTLEERVYSGGRQRGGPLTVANLGRRVLPLQKLLFSATLSQDPERLEQLHLFEPRLFRCAVSPQDIVGGGAGGGALVLPPSLRQLQAHVEAADKPLAVSICLQRLGLASALVFTHSSEAVARLCLLLQQLGHSAAQLTSAVSGRKRRALLRKLEVGDLQVLVCSDALARGIDVASLAGVISYDAPSHAHSYVHRVGRTARAGAEGTALTICDLSQAKAFSKMMKEAKLGEVELIDLGEGLDEKREAYSEALEATKKILEDKSKELSNKRKVASK